MGRFKVSRFNSTLVKNINGKTAGKTLNAHAEMPARVTSIYCFGEIIMQTIKYRTNIVKKRRYFFKTHSNHLTFYTIGDNIFYKAGLKNICVLKGRRHESQRFI